MAELAIGAFTAIGSGLGAVAPAISTTMTVLQGVATAGSVLMSIMSAKEEQRAGAAAAEQATMRAGMERLEGQREATESAARALEIRREHARKVGAARVAFGASGLDISSGQLDALEGDLGNQATFGLDMERSNQRQALLLADLRAGQYEAQADNAIVGARARSNAKYVEAAASGAKGLLSIVKRG